MLSYGRIMHTVNFESKTHKHLRDFIRVCTYILQLGYIHQTQWRIFIRIRESYKLEASAKEDHERVSE